MTSIAERLEEVRERIRRAAERARRDPATVKLIAVSKTHPESAVVEAYAAGQRDFGENYAQELATKAESLAHLTELRWHMIGHVQRNKAKLVVRSGAQVHSVDSAELVTELARRLRALETENSQQRPILVEVNVGREGQKHGVFPENVEPVLAAVEREPELRLCGLMCVPPYHENPEQSRPYFEALAALRTAHGGAERLPELSMGMTADLEPAVAAGATIVRVGTAIFGERPRRAN